MREHSLGSNIEFFNDVVKLDQMKTCNAKHPIRFLKTLACEISCPFGVSEVPTNNSVNVWSRVVSGNNSRSIWKTKQPVFDPWLEPRLIFPWVGKESRESSG